MIYDVRHRTTFGYEEPVSVSQHVLHLMPRDTPAQSRLVFELDVRPDPTAVSVSDDYFGNAVHHLSVQEPHRELIIESRSRIDVSAGGTAGAGPGLPWEDIVSARTQAPAIDQFAYDSQYSGGAPAARRYALESFFAGRGILEAVLDLTGRIFRDFKYEGGASDVSTPVRQVLEMRKGVCQDFAHLELACLRGLGLPARYVSGYLLTHPPPGQKKLVGADASHAWISVWCGPDLGWIDFDPTNNTIPGVEHITVAWGRDYGDVSPINGFIIGGGEHRVSVGVDVMPIAA
jgi:transglutaminase-like putative cysteine protease